MQTLNNKRGEGVMEVLCKVCSKKVKELEMSSKKDLASHRQYLDRYNRRK